MTAATENMKLSLSGCKQACCPAPLQLSADPLKNSAALIDPTLMDIQSRHNYPPPPLHPALHGLLSVTVLFTQDEGRGTN